MKKYIYVILILTCFVFSCKSDNKTKQSFTSKGTASSSINNYSSVLIVDKLPTFTYKEITRQIQPYDSELIKDSLLSVYLEDNIQRPIDAEGIFYYNIFIFIDKTGAIKEVEFQKDEYKSEELTKNIKLKLFTTKLIPAKKAGKNVPVRILVRICLDLYDSQSEINKHLFDKSITKQ